MGESILFKLIYNMGAAIGGIASAGGQMYAANKSYDTAVATNNTNLQINRETNQANKEINDATNLANKTLAEQQNAWNIQQWDRENLYNSPAEQLKRLQDAGLNPALVDIGSSAASNLQSANLANQQVGNPMQSTMLTNPAEQSSQIMATAFNTIGSTINQMAQAYTALNKLKMDKDLYPYQKELIKSTAQNYIAEALLKEKDLAYSDEKFRLQFNKMYEEAERARKEGNTAESTAALNQQKVEESKQNVMESQQRVEESKQRVIQSKSQTANIDIQTAWYTPKVRAEITKLYSAAGLDKKNTEWLDKNLPLILKGHELDNDAKEYYNTEVQQVEKAKLTEVLLSLVADNMVREAGLKAEIETADHARRIDAYNPLARTGTSALHALGLFAK